MEILKKAVFGVLGVFWGSVPKGVKSN